MECLSGGVVVFGGLSHSLKGLRPCLVNGGEGGIRNWTHGVLGFVFSMSVGPFAIRLIGWFVVGGGSSALCVFCVIMGIVLLLDWKELDGVFGWGRGDSQASQAYFI